MRAREHRDRKSTDLRAGDDGPGGFSARRAGIALLRAPGIPSRFPRNGIPPWGLSFPSCGPGDPVRLTRPASVVGRTTPDIEGSGRPGLWKNQINPGGGGKPVKRRGRTALMLDIGSGLRIVPRRFHDRCALRVHPAHHLDAASAAYRGVRVSWRSVSCVASCGWRVRTSPTPTTSPSVHVPRQPAERRGFGGRQTEADQGLHALHPLNKGRSRARRKV